MKKAVFKGTPYSKERQLRVLKSKKAVKKEATFEELKKEYGIKLKEKGL